MNDIIKAQPMAAFAENYQVCINEMSRAWELMKSATDRMKPFVGDTFSIINRDISGYQFGRAAENIVNSTVTIKQYAWRNIADRLQVKAFMTVKRMEEFNKSIESGDLPDVTLENIYNFYKDFSSSINVLMDETIKEAFEFLRPRNSRHKTNTEYEIKKRVILTAYGISSFYTGQYLDQKLTCIDNVFHLLDGKGTAKYPDNLASQLQLAIREHRPVFETDYFKVKYYLGVGTIHIQFLRLDLLQKLNAQGGGARLK